MSLGMLMMLFLTAAVAVESSEVATVFGPEQESDYSDYGHYVYMPVNYIYGNGKEVNPHENALKRQKEQLEKQKREMKYLKQGWKTVGKYRLWFSKHKSNWQSASAFCKEKKARLASGAIKDYKSRQFIYDLVKRTRTPYWIGLNDIKQEGYYVWSNGGTMTNTDNLWSYGEPKKGARNYCDCVEVWFKHRGLNDVMCRTPIKFICEMDL